MYSSQNKVSIKVHDNKYCKVCADSKKPMSIVTSHNVRNLKNGAVTCPTLLEQFCNKCGKHGHVLSRCKLVHPPEEIASKKIKFNDTPAQKSKKTGFDALMSDSEDEPEEVEVEEEFVPIKPLLTGYAGALLKQVTIKVELTRTLPKLPTKDPRAKFSWADCESDSSGDEEDE